MKVFDVRVGDHVDGWAVRLILQARPRFASAPRYFLFEFERGGGDFDQVLTSNPPVEQPAHETKREWFRADEDLDVERR